MDPLILGISGSFGHDSAACLVRGHRVLAYGEEERFTRRKRSPGDLPLRSAEYCLRAVGIAPSDVDVLAISCDPALSLRNAEPLLQFERRFLESDLWQGHPRPRIERVPHHLAHAASAHFASGYADCAFLVMDGHGERASASVGSIRDGVGQALFEAPVSSSLGHFYSSVSKHVGLGAEDVGKLMGLAGYGRIMEGFRPFHLHADGLSADVSERVNASDHIDAFRQTREAWAQWLCATMGPPTNLSHLRNVPSERVLQSFPSRALHLAASAQAALAEAVHHLAFLARSATGADALVVAGGVGLNCSANGALVRQGLFKQVFFMPASGDAGSALGAAVALARPSSRGELSVYQGPVATPTEIANEIRDLGLRHEEPSDPVSAALSVLCDGGIVGWYQGAAEMGPRALGSRSILALPSSVETRNAVNVLKGRELWRPLSPSLIRGAMQTYFDSIEYSPHMLIADTVATKKRSAIPGVVHHDGSARPQSVDASLNPRFARLLHNVGQQIGDPVLLNTSFNDAQEPIVNSPRDALSTFMRTGLDLLAIGPFVVRKPWARA